MRFGAVVNGLLLLSATFITCHGLKTEGKSFVLAFQDSIVEQWQDLPLEVWVINSGSSSAVVSITAPRATSILRAECTGSTTVVVGPGEQHMFGVCWYGKIMPEDTGISGKALRVESSEYVSVIAVNKEAFSGDAYQVLPISSLGTSYYTIVAGPGVSQPNQFSVIATEDETSVTISLPVQTEGPQVSFIYDCLVYEAGTSFTIKLNAHQVFSIMDMADITGTKILASKPVAVFNGNNRMHIPVTDDSRDHICEQAISIGNWDDEYAYVEIGPNSNDHIRFFSGQNHLDIIWTAANGTTGIIQLDEGMFMDFTPFGNTHFISASQKKFSAILFTSSVTAVSGFERDPVMLHMQGSNQWAGNYTMPPFVSAKSTLNNDPPAPYTHNYFVVVAQSASLSGLRLDGEPLSFATLSACSDVPNSGMGCLIDVNGTESHVLSHDNGDVFGAVMLVTTDRESLGTTLALNGPVQCEAAVMTRGDGIDNDCDGNIDEEICDGIDNDSDMLTDEDCASSSGRARGRTYFIVFPDNSKSDGQSGDLNQLQLYISPQNTVADTFVSVSNPLGSYFLNMTAPPQETAVIDLPTSLRLPQGSGKFSNGILIKASDDVVVYAMNKIKFSAESYLALPVDGIGYDYYVATIAVSDSNDRAEIAVCAADSDTTVLEITLADIDGVSVSYEGRTYGRGTTIVTSLIQYQCLQLQSPNDLTGSRVLSTNQKRISVFSGNRRPIIGPGNARDHIVEQINPVPTWGRKFYTVPIERDGTMGNTRGDIFRVITSQDSTTVSITSNGSASISNPVIALKGQFIEIAIESTEYTFISATKPVLLVQYSKTQLNNNQDLDKGDPSMTLVVPKESWSNDYRFVTPRSGQVDPNNEGQYLPYESKMNIAIEKQVISQLRYGTVDDLFSDAFPSAVWMDIPGTNPLVSATTVRVAFGQNYVTAAGDNVFSAVVYGAADREFYANPISLKLISTECIITQQVMDDASDNDCDGVIDEELCNGLDDDNDGMVDEDCATPPDGSQGSYLFAFMENTVEYPILNPLNIMVTSKCEGPTQIRMRTPNAPSSESCDINAQLAEGAVRRFALPGWFEPEGTAMANRSILIESSCPISVAGYNMDRFSADAFMVLPATMLGREYRTMSYYPVTLGSVLSVVATDATIVNVILPDHGPASPSFRHPITNVSYSGGQAFSTYLAQYEIMQLVAENKGDLSGTIITSADTDLAVFSGNLRVGIDAKSRDHLAEQLPPWSMTSNDWVVATNGMTDPEIVKFTCDAGVTITFHGATAQNFTFLNDGDVEQIELSRYHAERVTATGKCQLVLITISQASKAHPLQGDPTMSLIVPITQHVSSVNFAVPAKPWRKTKSGGVDEYVATLVVVAKNSQINSIKLDGNALSGWEVVDSTYAVTRVQLDKKAIGETYSLKSDNGEVFDARLWGIADREAFAYPLGM